MIKIGIYTVFVRSRKGVDYKCQKTPHTLISDIKSTKIENYLGAFFCLKNLISNNGKVKMFNY